MSADADVVEGDTILSGGVGSMYPAELPIGTVVSVTLDEYSRTKVATVQPSVDFSSLRYMMIVTGYDIP
jgi:rod shape-determining protein MreC